MKAAIIANGNINQIEKMKERIGECDLSVCCDGGARHFLAMQIFPDYLVGDFDSIEDGLVARFEEAGTAIETYPCEKDVTDTFIAIDLAIEKGASEIELYGVTGQRLDHTFSSIFMLEYLQERGVKGKVIDDHNEIFLLDEMQRQIEVKNQRKDTPLFFSLISLERVSSGITLEGFKYPLDHAQLKRGSSLGVSNEILGEKGLVTLRKGRVLIFLSRD